MPSRPTERGRPGPGLLAHVLISRYADRLPLNRQSQVFEREGLGLDRSTLADRVGKSTALMEPRAEAIGRHVLAGTAIFANDTDDTPVKMLAPGAGKTATARLWTYGRDERAGRVDLGRRGAAAIACTLIETAKLNGVGPQGWLIDTLACIPDYKITRVNDLLPWNWSNRAA